MVKDTVKGDATDQKLLEILNQELSIFIQYCFDAPAPEKIVPDVWVLWAVEHALFNCSRTYQNVSINNLVSSAIPNVIGEQAIRAWRIKHLDVDDWIINVKG